MDIKPPRKRPLGKPMAGQRMRPNPVPRPVNPSQSVGAPGNEATRAAQASNAPAQYNDAPVQTEAEQRPLQSIDESRHSAKKPKKKRKTWLWVLLSIIVLIGAAIAGSMFWYQAALGPVDSDNDDTTRLEIISGTTPAQIGAQLAEEDLIRSELAFSLHTRFNDIRGSLQAGIYELSPSQSTPAIAAALTEGPDNDEFEVTFLPGATLLDHRQVLIDLGYEAGEVDAALEADYDHALLENKPNDASLEGYIYGETHRFVAGTAVEDILNRYFDELYQLVFTQGLADAYAEQDLSFHEGIILASIIQKEVSGEVDSAQVAQIMYSRLDQGIPLGMDATFYYAAEIGGYTPRVDDDSLYNTRVHAGLPPGPIASPGYDALMAVANPADTDYLYFVSGDDGINYFSRTEEEHQRLTREHCAQNCQIQY